VGPSSRRMRPYRSSRGDRGSKRALRAGSNRRVNRQMLSAQFPSWRSRRGCSAWSSDTSSAYAEAGNIAMMIHRAGARVLGPERRPLSTQLRAPRRPQRSTAVFPLFPAARRSRPRRPPPRRPRSSSDAPRTPSSPHHPEDPSRSPRCHASATTPREPRFDPR